MGVEEGRGGWPYERMRMVFMADENVEGDNVGQPNSFCMFESGRVALGFCRN